jgi:hypothetical protein
MLRRLVDLLRGHGIALLALFVALGGTAYATTAVPRNSVGTNQLETHAVTSSKLARNSVTGRSVRDRSLQIGDLSLRARALLRAGGAPGSVNSGALAKGAVTTVKLADASVTAAKIVDGAVTAADLAASSVTTAQLAHGSVTGAKLAPESVTGANVPLRMVTAVGHVNGFRSTTLTATCPPGTRAFGGGVSIDTTFANGKNVATIQRDAPAGRDGIPVSWVGKVTDTDTTLGADFTVYAICA